LLAKVLCETGVELVLVEIGRAVRGIELVSLLADVLLADARKRLREPVALGGEQFLCPIGVHRQHVTAPEPLCVPATV
jgi:hypothetical protein